MLPEQKIKVLVSYLRKVDQLRFPAMNVDVNVANICCWSALQAPLTVTWFLGWFLGTPGVDVNIKPMDLSIHNTVQICSNQKNEILMDLTSPCEFRGGTWVLWFYNLKLKVHRFRQVAPPTKSQHLPISSLQNHDTNPHKKFGIL